MPELRDTVYAIARMIHKAFASRGLNFSNDYILAEPNNVRFYCRNPDEEESFREVTYDYGSQDQFYHQGEEVRFIRPTVENWRTLREEIESHIGEVADVPWHLLPSGEAPGVMANCRSIISRRDTPVESRDNLQINRVGVARPDIRFEPPAELTSDVLGKAINSLHDAAKAISAIGKALQPHIDSTVEGFNAIADHMRRLDEELGLELLFALAKNGQIGALHYKRYAEVMGWPEPQEENTAWYYLPQSGELEGIPMFISEDEVKEYFLRDGD